MDDDGKTPLVPKIERQVESVLLKGVLLLFTVSTGVSGVATSIMWLTGIAQRHITISYGLAGAWMIYTFALCVGWIICCRRYR